VEFAKKIIKSTEEIFNTMVFLDITAAEACRSYNVALGCHVSSIIGLSGDFTSMLGIHCPGDVGMAITGGMLGMEVEKVDADVKDSLGEIVNMIAGGLKEAFAAENIKLELSIPTTVTGMGYNVSSPTDSNQLVIPFDLEQGRFFVEIKYSSN
jgi:chemotaxis protein CheX